VVVIVTDVTGWRTVTVQVSEYPLLSAAVAVITAVPAVTAVISVTVPLAGFTLATEGAPDDQLRILLVALTGLMAAFMVAVSPTNRVSAGCMSTDVTETVEPDPVLTVTAQVLLVTLLPSVDVAVIFAVPGLTALTTPPLTVATLSLEDDQIRV
jgi:hypothetical protein